MSENLYTGFFSNGPYLHTKAYHFREDVHNQIANTSFSNNEIVDDIQSTIIQLEGMSSQLKD
jgi:hypothetical protein